MMQSNPRVAVTMSYLSTCEASRKGIAAAVGSLLNQPGLDITLCIRVKGSPASIPMPQDGLTQRVTQTDEPETWPESHNFNLRDLARHGLTFDFYAVLNADDAYLPGGLSTLVGELQAAPDAVLSYCDYIAVTPDGQETRGNVTAPNKLDLAERYGLGPFICWRGSCMFEYDMDRIPVFDEQFSIAADWALAVRLSKLGPFVCAVGPHGRFLDRPDSLSHANPVKLRAEQAELRKWAREHLK